MRHPQIRPNFCRQARWLIFRLSRLSAKLVPDANTPKAKLQLLATIQQASNKKFVNKKYGFEAFSRQIWIPILFWASRNKRNTQKNVETAVPVDKSAA